MEQQAFVVAISAMIVSVVSLAASIYFGWCTRDHNRRSVKPLPHLVLINNDDRICVRLYNNGLGPLVLRKVTARNKQKLSGHLIEIVPKSPPNLYFRHLVKVRPGRAVLPEIRLDLLDFELDVEDSAAEGYRDALRDALGDISIDVDYTDIYESRFARYTEHLTRFRR